jgi:hypothetical protein
VFATLLELPALDLADLTPEKILHQRLVKKGNVAVVQILIQWLGLPESLATWGYAASSGASTVTTSVAMD